MWWKHRNLAPGYSLHILSYYQRMLGGSSREQRDLILKRIKSYHLLGYLWAVCILESTKATNHWGSIAMNLVSMNIIFYYIEHVNKEMIASWTVSSELCFFFVEIDRESYRLPSCPHWIILFSWFNKLVISSFDTL